MMIGVYRVNLKHRSGEIAPHLVTWTGKYWRFVKHHKSDTITKIPASDIKSIISFQGIEK